MSKRTDRLLHALAPWALPVALVAVWQLAVQTGWLSSRILPAPSAVLAAGYRLARSGEASPMMIGLSSCWKQNRRTEIAIGCNSGAVDGS